MNCSQPFIIVMSNNWYNNLYCSGYYKFPTYTSVNKMISSGLSDDSEPKEGHTLFLLAFPLKV